MCYIELEQKNCHLVNCNSFIWDSEQLLQESIDESNTFNCFLPAELGSDLLYNLGVKLSVLQISENF